MTERLDVELDDVEQVEDRLGERVRVEPIEREPVALGLEGAQRPDELLVEDLGAGDLQATQARGDRLHQPVEHELPWHVDPRLLAADDALQVELGERVEHHRGGASARSAMLLGWSTCPARTPPRG